MLKSTSFFIAAAFTVTLGLWTLPGQATKAPALSKQAAAGKTIYDGQCSSCHGPMGKGDGPAAAAINPKPRNLADKKVMTILSDADLTKAIKLGGAAINKSPMMPPFGASLKDADITNVVAYLRALCQCKHTPPKKK